MWKWIALSACVGALVPEGYASRPVHRTRDLIRPHRDLLRPDRIVGGEPVKRGEMPWQVSIQLRAGSMSKHFCGGTLIADSWVITAAHCTRDIDYGDVVVVTGAWDLKEPNNEYRVTRVIAAAYDPITFEHDLALLKLDVEDPVSISVRTNQQAIPVSLESSPEASIGKRCTISGWGKLKAGGELPHILMAADVEVRSDEDCLNAFSLGVYDVFNSNLCAGGRDRDACQGDSGGPLVCCEESTAEISSCRIAGVVSWGIGCATRGIPGVYTEVAYYTDWIMKVIQDEDGEEDDSRITLFKAQDHLDQKE